ncbi:Csu type fimbrial protein [Sphingomonas sp. ERG5]|uniref:Csu type fimbrial protein n=1 Tax=Sphingomonas sp. ERG5 TaxID=1381597 RepID=UPI00054C57BB|nr:spore coat U domain-containing protein [Sphingomonas sp. ERG5]
MNRTLYALALPALLIAAPAFADTDTDTLNVTANVVASCSITSTSTLAFGSVTQSATNIDNTGSVDLICTNTTPWFLSAAAGTNASGAQNRMKHATLAQFLNYDIYSDTGRATPFPTVAGTLGAGNTGGAGTGTTQTVTVYGRIPAGQTLPSPGSYTDTVTMTVTY